MLENPSSILDVQGGYRLIPNVMSIEGKLNVEVKVKILIQIVQSPTRMFAK